jgi:hypothetical protein
MLFDDALAFGTNFFSPRPVYQPAFGCLGAGAQSVTGEVAIVVVALYRRDGPISRWHETYGRS